MKKQIFIMSLLMFYQLCCAGGGYSMEYTGKRTKLFCNGAAVDFVSCAKEQMARSQNTRLF
jgi:hypothetical protein